jgi:hypothetical protein
VGFLRGSDCQYDTGCGFDTWVRLSVRYRVWVSYMVQAISKIEGVFDTCFSLSVRYRYGFDTCFRLSARYRVWV